MEWSFKVVKKMWSSQSFKSMLKVRAAPIYLLYQAEALFCNLEVCLGHGGQVATRTLIAKPRS